MGKPISFYAMLDRIKYIERWSLMKNTEKENVKEHTFDVILLVHSLIEIRKTYFPEKKPEINIETAMLYALYHDVSEMITGDMPTPVKYFNQNMREQYQVVEEYAIEAMLSLLPEELKECYKFYLKPDFTNEDTQETWKLVKAADTLSAYLKCLSELKQGNTEFKEAAACTKEKLISYQLEEVNWFLKNAVPAYELTLDQLQSPLL